MSTRYLTITSLLSITLFILLWAALGPARAQDPSSDLLALINDTRLAQGLYPYVASSELSAAAQRHSDDMAATGQVNHTGSDGSSETQRIMEAGYGVYEFGPVVGENIYGGLGAADVAFDVWLNTPGDRTNLLHQEYREVGVGVSSSGGQSFWTVTFGAQPNVLPVLVNNGAGSVDTITVTLTLLPENAVPDGRGTAIGQPTEYRASTSSEFSGAEWEPWAERVTFILDETPGQQTVNVQLRDAAGRTAISWTAVTLAAQEVTTTPAEPEETETPTTATATETVTPTLAATGTPTVTATVTATATRTPRPTRTARPSATATTAPTSPPTATPPLSAAPTRTPAPTATIPPPTMTSTPPAPTLRPAPVVEEDESEPVALALRLAPWALGLQVVALILGLYLALRRTGEGEIGDDSPRSEEERD